MIVFNKSNQEDQSDEDHNINERIAKDLLSKKMKSFEIKTRRKSMQGSAINNNDTESIIESPIKSIKKVNIDTSNFEKEYIINFSPDIRKTKPLIKNKESMQIKRIKLENRSGSSLTNTPVRAFTNKNIKNSVMRDKSMRRSSKISSNVETNNRRNSNILDNNDVLNRSQLKNTFNNVKNLGNTMNSPIPKSPNDFLKESHNYPKDQKFKLTNILYVAETDAKKNQTPIGKTNDEIDYSSNSFNEYSLNCKYWSNNSLFMFSRNSRIRKLCFDLVNSRAFSILLLILVFLDSINFTIWINCKDYSIIKLGKLRWVLNVISVLDKVFFAIYILEVLLKSIAIGFYKGDKSYIKQYSNIFDLFILIISFFPYISRTFYYLRTFRYLKILKLVSVLPKLNNLLIMLVYSLRELKGIFYLIIFYLIIFSLVGMVIFEDKQYYKCMKTSEPINGSFEESTLYNIEQKFQSNFNTFNTRNDDNNVLIRYYHANNNCGGFRSCSDYSYCRSLNNAFELGIYFIKPNILEKSEMHSFKNINNSLFSLLIAMTSNQIIELMAILINTYDFYVTAIFFYFVVVVLFNYFILKVIIGVMINSCRINYHFSDQHLIMESKLKEIDFIIDNVKNNELFDILKYYESKKELEEEGIDINDLDDPNDNNSIKDTESKKAKKKQKEQEKFTISFDLASLHKSTKFIISSISFFENVEPFYMFHKKWNFYFICYYVTQQPIIRHVLTILSLVNLILVSYQAQNIKNLGYLYFNFIIVLIMFSITLVSALGKGIRNYLSNFPDLYESLVLSLTIIEFAINKTTVISCLYFLRSLSFLFYFKSLNLAYKCMVSTLKEMINFIILATLFIYFFVLTGQNIYINKLKFKNFATTSNEELNENYFNDISIPFDYSTSYEYKRIFVFNGYSPVLNFDSLFTSFFSVMTIFVGDDWNELFRDCYSSVNVPIWITYAYFLLATSLLSIMLPNIVIAFLVFHFEVSRKKLIFEEKYKNYLKILKDNKIKRTKSVAHNIIIPLRCIIPPLEENIEHILEDNIDINKLDEIEEEHQSSQSRRERLSIENNSGNNATNLNATRLNKTKFLRKFYSTKNFKSDMKESSITKLTVIAKQQIASSQNKGSFSITKQESNIISHNSADNNLSKKLISSHQKIYLHRVYDLKKIFITNEIIKNLIENQQNNGKTNIALYNKLRQIIDPIPKIAIIDNTNIQSNSVSFSNYNPNKNIANNLPKENPITSKRKSFNIMNQQSNLDDIKKYDERKENLKFSHTKSILKSVIKKFNTIKEDGSDTQSYNAYPEIKIKDIDKSQIGFLNESIASSANTFSKFLNKEKSQQQLNNNKNIEENDLVKQCLQNNEEVLRESNISNSKSSSLKIPNFLDQYNTKSLENINYDKNVLSDLNECERNIGYNKFKTSRDSNIEHNTNFINLKFKTKAENSLVSKNQSINLNSRSNCSDKSPKEVKSSSNNTIENVRNKFLITSYTHKKSSKKSSISTIITKQLEKNDNSYWKDWPNGFSLFLFSPRMKLRKFVYKLVESHYTHRIALIMCCLNVIVLSLEHPGLDTNSNLVHTYHKIDYFFSIFFFIELVLRVFAQGLFFDSKNQVPCINCFKSKIKSKKSDLELKVLNNTANHLLIKDNNDLGNFINPNKSNIKKSFRRSTGFGSNLKYELLMNMLNMKKKENQSDNHYFASIPAYMRNYFNIVDGVVTIYAFVQFIYLSSHISSDAIMSFSSFKALVALRPFTMVNKFGTLRRVVDTVLKSIKMIISLFVLIIFICTVLGIIIHNVLVDKKISCSNTSILTEAECIINGFLWKISDYSYEKLSTAILILIEIGAAENWFKIKYTSLITIHKGELTWVNFQYFLYSMMFVLVLIITAVFLLNLTYAVIVDSYASTKELQMYDMNVITEDQKDYFFILEKFLQKKPRPYLKIEKNMDYFQKKSLQFITSSFYTKGLLYLHLFFCLSLLITQLNQSSIISQAQFYIFILYVLICNITKVIRIFALPSFYFKYFSFYYELIELIIINVTLILEIIYDSRSKSFIGLSNGEIDKFELKENRYSFIPIVISFKFIRLRKVIPLCKRLKEYNDILKQLIPNIINITYLIIILFAIYANVGMSFMGNLRYGKYINGNNNFERIENALLVLIKCLIGAKWNSIMREASTALPGCVFNQKHEDLILRGPNECGGFRGYIYFMSFFILFYILVMNLFVAIIVDTFIANSRSFNMIKEREIEYFFELWSKYDNNMDMRITPEALILLMIELKHPFGFSEKEYSNLRKKKDFQGKLFISPDNKIIIDRVNLIQLSKNIKLSMYDNEVHLLDVIKIIIERIIKHHKPKIVKNENLTNKKFTSTLEGILNAYDKNYVSSNKVAHELSYRKSKKKKNYFDDQRIKQGVQLFELIAEKTIREGIRKILQKRIRLQEGN